MPFAESSLDLIYNIFSPVCEDEFHRVLKPGGKLIVAGPGALHLYELKSALYSQAYENDEEKLKLKKFKTIEKIKLEYKFTVLEKNQILNLIKMTPYYWKTSKESIDNMLERNDSLDLTASFFITVLEEI